MDIVTTDRKNHEGSLELAKWAAEKLNWRFVPRYRTSVPELMEKYETDKVLIAKKGMLTLVTKDGELFFHPNIHFKHFAQYFQHLILENKEHFLQ